MKVLFNGVLIRCLGFPARGAEVTAWRWISALSQGPERDASIRYAHNCECGK